MTTPKRKSKFWKEERFVLKNLATWNRCPILINDSVVNGVLEKLDKTYNPKHIQYTLSLMVSEIAQFFKEAEENKNVIFDGFGTIKLTLYDKVIKLPNTKKIRYNAKRIRFAFEFSFKHRCYRILNKDNEVVQRYLDEKRQNRHLARKWFA